MAQGRPAHRDRRDVGRARAAGAGGLPGGGDLLLVRRLLGLLGRGLPGRLLVRCGLVRLLVGRLLRRGTGGGLLGLERHGARVLGGALGGLGCCLLGLRRGLGLEHHRPGLLAGRGGRRLLSLEHHRAGFTGRSARLRCLARLRRLGRLRRLRLRLLLRGRVRGQRPGLRLLGGRLRGGRLRGRLRCSRRGRRAGAGRFGGVRLRL